MVQIPHMPHFEVPQQLREVTERNIKQAREAYGHLVDAMVQITGLWMAALPTNPLTSGFKTVQDRGVRFAKENAEAGFARDDRAYHCQEYRGRARDSAPLCPEPNAGICFSGAGTRPTGGRSCEEFPARKLKSAQTIIRSNRSFAVMESLEDCSCEKSS